MERIIGDVIFLGQSNVYKKRKVLDQNVISFRILLKPVLYLLEITVDVYTFKKLNFLPIGQRYSNF